LEENKAMVNNTARGSSTSLRKDMVPFSETDIGEELLV